MIAGHSTRIEVLELLRRRGSASADEIAGELGITANAVRQHLANLEREGLVASEPHRQKRGRPAFRFSLTARADAIRPFIAMIRTVHWSSSTPLPALRSADVRELDRLSSERFGIPVDWLMEAAGWQVARHCDGKTVVACGTGNNGGDALAAARHLHRWERLQSVACVDRAALKGATATEAEALEKDGVQIADDLVLDGAEIILDGLLGTGLSRQPTGRYADWINAIDKASAHVVAIDIPSGLEADSGRAFEPAIRADKTVTLGLPKVGLLEADGPLHAGEIWVADIGIPLRAYEAIGIHVPSAAFGARDCIRLEPR
jgi:hydroxyethylthiazole kinase-like uncharacterized protein yjeF